MTTKEEVTSFILASIGQSIPNLRSSNFQRSIQPYMRRTKKKKMMEVTRVMREIRKMG